MGGAILWAALPPLAAAALALVYWLWLDARGRPEGRWSASVVKTLATLGLAASGWGLGLPGPLVWGATLGALGDFCLSRPGQNWFLAGMAAFGAGHLTYAGWMGLMGPLRGLPAQGGPVWLALVLAALGLAGVAAWLSPRLGRLRGPVMAYLAASFALAALAILFPPAEGRAVLRAGVALFLTSDLILAARLFRPESRLARAERAIWPAYWLGQALILAGGGWIAG